MRLRVHDIALNVELAGAGRPLLLLHGFTGSAAAWAALIPRLAQHMRTLAVDLIGHGRSDAPHDPERYRMERCVEDLLALLDALEVDSAAVLGYSMGGRVALHLAAAAPGRIAALALESSSPGIADVAERQARVTADEALANAIEREGVDAFVDRWEALPLFTSQASLPAHARARLRAQRLQNRAIGLANSLRGMGAGRQEPLWERLPTLDVPTLLIAGELDTKYCAITRHMAAALPNARHVIVRDAGHAVHLEQPDAFMNHVLDMFQANFTV
jgi:2-succinyl-6-hydroxy-2,4-cyclohexadiene-1-carboxylate synthase